MLKSNCYLKHSIFIILLITLGCGPGFDNGQVNKRPSITIVTPTEVQSGDVGIIYTLFDGDTQLCQIWVEYSQDGGITYSLATSGVGGDGITLLDSAPGGVEHTFVWDSVGDIGNTAQDDIRIRITPMDPEDVGSADETDNFTVDNN